jgi:hypothetical protein
MNEREQERFREVLSDVENLQASQRALLKAQVVMNAELGELAARTERSFQRLHEEVRELSASVKTTDANVAALTTMFQEWIERQNGSKS